MLSAASALSRSAATTITKLPLPLSAANKSAVFLSPVVAQACPPVRHGWGPEHRAMPRGRHRPNKHWPEKWRKARAAKVLRVDLPDFDFQRQLERDEVSPSEMRAHLRKAGMLMPTGWQEKAIYLSCMGAVLDPFVPPEGDGKAKLISKERAQQSVSVVGKKGKSYLATRKIRNYEEDFDPRTFVDTAQDIYVKTHIALAEGNEDELHKLVTERLYPEMMFNVEGKSMRWSFIKSLEPPRVVQIRTQDVLSKANIFAQVTVRFHTQQTLAVYDRFGRLLHGDKTSARDVLEYVVFERHVANVYGAWRMHAKIIPSWAENREPGYLSHVLEKEPVEEAKAEEESADKPEESGVKASGDESDEQEKETTVVDRFGKKIS